MTHLFHQLSRESPTLLYAFALLAGCLLAFQSTPYILIPFSLLLLYLLTLQHIRLCFFLLLLFGGCYHYSQQSYQLLELPNKGVSGTGILHIHSLSLVSGKGKPHWKFRGTLRHFQSPKLSKTGKNLPVSVTFPSTRCRPKAHCDYIIQGQLFQGTGNYYFMKPSRAPWEPLVNTWSLAEWRYGIAEQIHSLLKKHVPQTLSQAFLTGLSTGQFDLPLLRQEFSRLGLQHIMAVSGFHFAVAVYLMSLVFSIFTRYKAKRCLLLVFVTFYALFIGVTPSIQRAWIMISIYLFAGIFERQASGLNTFGIALILSLLLDPLSVTTLGFQLSYLATFGILLLFQSTDHFLKKLFPPFPLEEILSFPKTHKFYYLVISVFRQSLALSISVHAFTLPLLLFTFHRFPLISLIYNLFFPFLVGICLFFLLLALLLSPVPWISIPILKLNSIYSEHILSRVVNFPLTLDYQWHARISSPFTLCILLTFITWMGIYLRYTQNKHAFSVT